MPVGSLGLLGRCVCLVYLVCLVHDNLTYRLDIVSYIIIVFTNKLVILHLIFMENFQVRYKGEIACFCA